GIAYDHDWIPARYVILFRRESASQRRGGAENGEEIVGNELSCDLLCVLRGRWTPEQQPVPTVVFGGGQIGEDLGVIPHVNVVGERYIPFRPVNFDDRFGILDRQRTRHNVKQGEDGSVDTDAESQREPGHRGETGMLPQHSRAEAQVLPEVRDHIATPG